MSKVTTFFEFCDIINQGFYINAGKLQKTLEITD